MCPRRIHLFALLLALVALAALYSPLVSAAPACGNNPRTCSQSEAATDAEKYARDEGALQCVPPAYGAFQKAEMYQHIPEGPGIGRYTGRYMCKQQNGSPGVSWRYTGLPSYYKNDCTTRAAVVETNHPNNALQCNKGCEHRFFIEPPNANGIVFSRGIATGNTCNPDNYTCPQGFRPGGSPPGWLTSRDCIPIVPEKCEEGQTLVNGVCKRTEACPDGMVQNAAGACEPKKGECPAGQVKAPDGSCVNDTKCPAGQARGKDGSCKKDSDGDGNPDPTENDGKFSGGDTCDEPPQCSGDNILCGQARIQWRIDCNTRRNANVSGGSCNAEPICTGEKCDALEYAQLVQQWRAACALERLVAKSNSTGTGSETGQPDWTKPAGMTQDPGQGSQAGDTNVFRERQVDATNVNTTPIVGGGGTCPGFPAAGGGTGHFAGARADLASPPPQWCDMIAALNKIILLFALVIAIYINVKG